MARNKRSKQVILETMSLRPDELMKSRDISGLASRIYRHSVSPKAVSKLIVQLQEIYPNIVRLQYNRTDTQINRCRYEYGWFTSGHLTMVEMCLV